MDDQEHAASPEPRAQGAQTPGDPASGQATPITGPGRDRRADGLREALTSRGAGWAVAAAMTGAVVGLSVAMATSSAPTVVVQPEGPAGLRGAPAGVTRAPGGGGGARALAPVRLQVQAPARAQVPAGLQAPARLRAQVPAGAPGQAPARLRLQVPAGMRLRAPARLRLQVPAGTPLQTPARLRLQVAVRVPVQVPARLPMRSPARLRAVAPVAPIHGARIQAVPRAVAPVAVPAPRTLHLRVRPAQVRVRLRIPARARMQVLPGTPPGPVRAVVPGPRAAEVLPVSGATPARLRIAFQRGGPVPARLLFPANLPGRARLRIQVPARARVTPALPAPPNW